MPHFYIDEQDSEKPYSLPTGLTFAIKEREALDYLDEYTLLEYLSEYPLASTDSQEHERMIQAMIDNGDLLGGWMVCICIPGCMPDSDMYGPFPTSQEAIKYLRNMYG
jgi:hypothetical protein